MINLNSQQFKVIHKEYLAATRGKASILYGRFSMAEVGISVASDAPTLTPKLVQIMTKQNRHVCYQK
jgi:hypothetical protein